MEPITTTAAVTTVVNYLISKFKENKSIQAFFSDFTEATVNWVRPLFLKDDHVEKEAIQKLNQMPDSSLKKEALEKNILSDLEDKPDLEKWIIEMAKEIAAKTGGTNALGGNSIDNKGDNNIIMQGISGSNINIR